MGEAMITGVIQNALARPNEVSVGEPLEERRKALAQKFGVAAVASNSQAAANADIVVLAVKPIHLAHVLQELRGMLTASQTVLSIVAGAKLSTVTSGLNHKEAVRVMPNAPAQVGAGMSVWTAAPEVPKDRHEKVRQLLRSFGEELYVADEKYLDMATALSASGPAYVFLFLEALIDAGVYLGFPRDMAELLAQQTLLGSAQMAKQTKMHPAELRAMVASPGGTTVEGLLHLEDGRLRATVLKAVVAAHNKAKALGG
ncbi:MAG: pyrroline-5-carboxylate reductase [Chloroflexi bacterium]|nr:pyrroline-5-carboxylate reductase [Chloroflexota bacterium]